MEDVWSCEGCHVKNWSVELRQEGQLSCKQCWESQTASGLPQPKFLFEALFDQRYDGEQADKERDIDRTALIVSRYIEFWKWKQLWKQGSREMYCC